MFGSWAIDPWPIRSGHLNGEQETGIRPFTNRVVWVEDIRNSGSTNRPYHITGYVKDNGGNPVSGATVNLVKVASQNSPFDDYIVDRQLSQEDGLYDFEVEDTTTLYYVEAFQASPAKAGMTSRTLVGA